MQQAQGQQSCRLFPPARALKLIVKQWQRADRLPDAVVVEGPLAVDTLDTPMDTLVTGTFDTLEDSLVDVVDYVRELEEKNDVKIPVLPAGGVRAMRTWNG